MKNQHAFGKMAFGTGVFPICLTLTFVVSLLQLPTQAQESQASSSAIFEEPITDDDREHWSFQPLARPPIPSVEGAAWCRNPIDSFILAQLEHAKLAPSAPCENTKLLRRVSIDLSGLPPSPDDIQSLATETDATFSDRYEQLVDRLLASPAFGERWGQHWLDLARYAETDGFEHDKTRQGVWEYRDWVVAALNQGMPYDEFVQLQISGDLIDGGEHAIATAFCTAGPDMPDINEQDLRRFDKLNELTGTVGSALLGLTMQCAQCHDHKYDPISQADFYRLRAVFSTAMPVMKRNQHVISLGIHADTPDPRLHFRGELGKPGPVVQAGYPRILTSAEDDLRCLSKHPRLEFAAWLFDPGNPITARVIANRIWQHHFGRSLTENPSDLGVVAGGPTHPALLDWLACELIQSGWDMKHLHRLILTSSTYRQSSMLEPGIQSSFLSDLAELYGVFPRRRMEGETVRDAMLHCSGLLTRDMGGPSVMPPLPPELTSTLLKGQWKTSTSDEDHYRRSIYVFARRNLRYPIFDVFDRPDAGASCARRDKSTTALQSLQMLNSPFTFHCAQALTSRSLRLTDAAQATPNPTAIVEFLFQTCYSRSPGEDEMRMLTDYLANSEDLSQRVLECAVALFNSNEFLYID